MLKNRIWIILIILLTLSCRRKDLPEPTTGSPVFFFKGNASGLPVDIEGGVNGYYLSTTDSIIQDSIYNLIGYLKPQSCSKHCPTSLKISISDYKNRRGASINDIGTVLKNGRYTFYSDSIGMDTIKVFEYSAPAGYVNYLWDFGDGTTSAVQNPTHIFNQATSSNVCLTVTSASGCKSSSCDSTYVTTSPALDLAFTYNYDTLGAITLTAPPGWDSYVWVLGDTSGLLNGQQIQHTYAPDSVYNVLLSTTKGSVHRNFTSLVSIPQGYSCTANWTYTTSYITKQGTGNSALGKVTIEWTDANGKSFISSLKNQPVSSSFNIKSGATYANNEVGQKTYKVNCGFDVILYDEAGTSQTVHLTGDNCNWGVAYP